MNTDIQWENPTDDEWYAELGKLTCQIVANHTGSIFDIEIDPIRGALSCSDQFRGHRYTIESAQALAGKIMIAALEEN